VRIADPLRNWRSTRGDRGRKPSLKKNVKRCTRIVDPLKNRWSTRRDRGRRPDAKERGLPVTLSALTTLEGGDELR
jgi:hypothetical protein